MLVSWDRGGREGEWEGKRKEAIIVNYSARRPSPSFDPQTPGRGEKPKRKEVGKSGENPAKKEGKCFKFANVRCCCFHFGQKKNNE